MVCQLHFCPDTKSGDDRFSTSIDKVVQGCYVILINSKILSEDSIIYPDCIVFYAVRNLWKYISIDHISKLILTALSYNILFCFYDLSIIHIRFSVTYIPVSMNWVFFIFFYTYMSFTTLS